MANPGEPINRGQLTSQIQALNTQIASLRTSYQPIFDRYPGAIQSGQFYPIASRIVAAKNEAGNAQGVGIPLTGQQAADLVRASFAELYRGQSLAKILTLASNDEQFSRNAPRVAAILDNNRRLAARLQQTVDSAHPENAAMSAFRRVIGLNGLSDIGNPLIIAGYVIIVLALAAAYFLIRHIYDSQQINQQVEDACAADARAGRPCTGQQMVEYRRELNQIKEEYGDPDPIGDLFSQIGSGVNALFWIFGIGIVAYGVFVTLPAAQAARERLRRESESRLLPSG